MLKIAMKLDMRKVVAAPALFRKAAAAVVMETATAIATDAAASAPEETGSLENSLYVVGLGEDGYDKAASDVLTANPKAVLFGKYEPDPDEDGEQSAYVVSAVQHGLLVELGTHKMPAQPFLNPSIEKHTEPFMKDVKTALEGTFK